MSKYHYIPNHRSAEVTSVNSLHDKKFPLPEIKTKSKFRDFCASNSTKHCFYTMAEGDNPSLRINEDNPVNKVHGFVADYDAPTDWAEIESVLRARCESTCLPTWITKTHSGYVRLVWEFEQPIPLDPAMADQFYKRVADHLKAPMLLAGFDRTCMRPSQYFEVGTAWTKLGEELDYNTVKTIFLKAASTAAPTTSDTTIPIEDVAAEVQRRFGDRWSGPFEIGARGPLFWINDGIEREGCQVREDGMVCYSDRAGKGFMSWREILGKGFVEKYEEKKLNQLIDQYWFSGKAFYKVLHNNPVVIPKEQLVLELRKAGFSLKSKKGQALSEVEQAILTISNDCRVEEVAPVVFSDKRLVTFGPRRILNSNYSKPVQPAANGDPENWPWLREFLMNFFDTDANGEDTLPYFLAWFKRLYLAVLEHRLDQGQLLILLGESGRGKTLLTNRIVGDAVGGCSDASDYLSGKTTFNKDLCGSAAWVIDDQTAAATYADQRKFVELTKRCVANPRLEYHAKYADAVPLPWAGRVMMSLNLDANSLAALPTLDSSNRDKIIALRAAGTGKVKFGSNKEVEQTISEELPFFLKWLVAWEAPEKVVCSSRFGVKTYIDPFVEAAAYDNSSRSAIAEMVEFFAKQVRSNSTDPISKWRGTLTEFTVTLHELNGGRSVGNSNNLEFVRRGMTVLEEVSAHNPSVRKVRSRGHGGGKVWEIDLDSRYDIDSGDEVW